VKIDFFNEFGTGAKGFRRNRVIVTLIYCDRVTFILCMMTAVLSMVKSRTSVAMLTSGTAKRCWKSRDRKVAFLVTQSLEVCTVLCALCCCQNVEQWLLSISQSGIGQVAEPTVECLTDGTVRRLVPPEHNVCRPGRSAAGTNGT